MRLFNGKKIPLFRKGDRRTVLSASVANEIARVINAFLSMRIVRGAYDAVFISDSVVVLQIARAPTEANGPYMTDSTVFTNADLPFTNES